MAAVHTYTIIDGGADGEYETLTHQGNVTARTVYVEGTFTGSVEIDASPSSDGDDWFEVLSENAEGVYELNTVCKRIRGRLADMESGDVVVRVACRVESRT